jgi:hypothetical protein
MLDVSFGVQSEANTKVQSTRRELKGYPHSPAGFSPNSDNHLKARLADRLPFGSGSGERATEHRFSVLISLGGKPNLIDQCERNQCLLFSVPIRRERTVESDEVLGRSSKKR